MCMTFFGVKLNVLFMPCNLKRLQKNPFSIVTSGSNFNDIPILPLWFQYVDDMYAHNENYDHSLDFSWKHYILTYLYKMQTLYL